MFSCRFTNCFLPITFFVYFYIFADGMRIRRLIFALLLCCVPSLWSAAETGVPRSATSGQEALLDEFLQMLDSVDYYKNERKQSIELMKICSVFDEKASPEQFRAYMCITEAYGKFNGDSCVVYIDKAISSACEVGLKELIYKAQIYKAKEFSILGYFTEASQILDSIAVDELDANLKNDYYSAAYELYYALYYNAFNEEYDDVYIRKMSDCRDHILSLSFTETDNYWRHLEKRYIELAQYDDAFAVNERRYNQTDNKEVQALVLYDRYILATKYMGEPVEKYRDVIILSAIRDLETANQDIASLLSVEKYLLAIGETESAKKVSDYYYSTMNEFGSRLRRLHGYEHSMAINAQYSAEIIRRQSQLTWAIICLSVLLVLAIVLLVWIFRVTRKVEKLNIKLRKSNLASKRYLLGFFQLYSQYIERLLLFRAKINTSIRRGNTNYVLELTNPDKNINDEELKQLYKNFDAAFLDIFPDYVVAFNDLLKPEFRYLTLPHGELNTELRIFALIKMGEKDSNTISKLLHCSIKTVYNKRSDIKRKLLFPGLDFEKELQKI